MSLAANVSCDRCVLVIRPTLACEVRCNVKVCAVCISSKGKRVKSEHRRNVTEGELVLISLNQTAVRPDLY